MKILAIDLESTGFPSRLSVPLKIQPHTWELAAALVDSESLKVEKTLEFRCRPPKAIPREIEELCGIRDEELDGEKTFGEHYSELEEIFSLADGWISHNLSFDASLLAIELARLRKHKDFPWPSVDLCSLQLSRDLFPRGPHKLRDLSYRIGVNYRQSHRAMSDVEALIEIVRWAIREAKFPFEGNFKKKAS